MDHGDQSERLELCVSATIPIAALDTTHHSCANIPDFQMTPRNSEPACVVRFRKVGGEGLFWSFLDQDITGPVSIVHHVRLPCIEHIGTTQIARENQNWKVF